jgi:hypothetical protein
MIEHKGINYDVGTVTDVNWRPDYNPQTVERENLKLLGTTYTFNDPVIRNRHPMRITA